MSDRSLKKFDKVLLRCQYGEASGDRMDSVAFCTMVHAPEIGNFIVFRDGGEPVRREYVRRKACGEEWNYWEFAEPDVAALEARVAAIEDAIAGAKPAKGKAA